VLADGSVVNASQSSNPDLFTVLKGGNNNFGIVTSLKFKTFPYEGMWGGLVTYPNTTVETQFEALVNFANKMDEDVNGAVIVIPCYLSVVGADQVLNTYDYARPTIRPAAYDEFMAIPGNISDTTGLRNMSSLAEEFKGATTHR
jgi:FAD/FMN-containing dehydrogenase